MSLPPHSKLVRFKKVVQPQVQPEAFQFDNLIDTSVVQENTSTSSVFGEGKPSLKVSPLGTLQPLVLGTLDLGPDLGIPQPQLPGDQNPNSTGSSGTHLETTSFPIISTMECMRTANLSYLRQTPALSLSPFQIFRLFSIG
jgi:hypothetical protein